MVRKLLFIYLALVTAATVSVLLVVNVAVVSRLCVSFKDSFHSPEAEWYLPQPPYPYAARAGHVSGRGVVFLTTDGSGRISDAHMQQSTGSKMLDANTVAFAVSNWHGPPDDQRQVPITYLLVR